MPIVIVSTARMATAPLQSTRRSAAGKATNSTRISAAKPATLAALLMNAVTDVGAPSYTSGTQARKGAAAILKPKPTSSKPNPISGNGLPAILFCAKNWAIAERLVVPVAPKVSAIPYNRNADAKPPSNKYFMPASALVARARLKADRTYSDSDSSSRPRKIVIRSLLVAITMPPAVTNSIRT